MGKKNFVLHNFALSNDFQECIPCVKWGTTVFVGKKKKPVGGVHSNWRHYITIDSMF